VNARKRVAKHSTSTHSGPYQESQTHTPIPRDKRLENPPTNGHGGTISLFTSRVVGCTVDLNTLLRWSCRFWARRTGAGFCRGFRATKTSGESEIGSLIQRRISDHSDTWGLYDGAHRGAVSRSRGTMTASVSKGTAFHGRSCLRPLCFSHRNRPGQPVSKRGMDHRYRTMARTGSSHPGSARPFTEARSLESRKEVVMRA
jgi:hypothetical protein